MNKMLHFKEFYDNLDILIKKGIVIKKNSYYWLGKDKFFIFNNKVYINTEARPVNMKIYSKSYIEHLDKQEFKYEKTLCFANEVDLKKHLHDFSYPSLLYKLEIER